MDWNRFDPHGEDPRAAFEALTAQLFERWCRREYPHPHCEVRCIDGKGGDGGVEAYATLGSGSEVGLQAKWFQGLGDKQIKQIDESLRTAVEVHPRLVHYIVAIPKDLGDKRRGRGRSESERWEAWRAAAMTLAPAVKVQLWGTAQIELLLAENEGLEAYWFSDRRVTQTDLARRFEVAERGWLSHRYLPDLHAAGDLEQHVALLLGAPEARGPLHGEVRAAIDEISSLRDDIERLTRYPSFTARADAVERRAAALVALGRLLTVGEALATALRTGRRVKGPPPFGTADEEALRRIDETLSALNQDAGALSAPTRTILDRLRHVLWENQTPLPILSAWRRWESTGKIAAFIGAPGIGKTHGLAHAVESQRDRAQPALLLRAKDCSIETGWAGILSAAVERPTMSLEGILNALEAVATRADVRRAREEAAQPAAPQVEREATAFLLAIDGLEESGRHHRWAELLGELAAHLDRHPRLRAAVSLRTAAEKAILGRCERDACLPVPLHPAIGEVQDLLSRYCAHMQVPLPDRRHRWAIREPLSVRLYCELAKQVPGLGTDRQALSMPRLLRAKLDLVEEAIREKGGWSPHVSPLRAILRAVASLVVEHGAVTRADAIAHAARSQVAGLTEEKWSLVIDQAEECGLLLVHTEEPEVLHDLPISHVEPANEPLLDYLIAEIACKEMACAISRGERPALGTILVNRPDSQTQAAVLLAQRGVGVMRAGLWEGEIPEEQREVLELRAIAALDDERANSYTSWVRERLLASMPSCRRVLAELCIPVARDGAHPLGPRFVHEALLPLLPAKRDLFWSGPSYLPADGAEPGEGAGLVALEDLAIQGNDRADGPPLLLAWALTTVDNRWRRRLRAELSRWGEGRLDELVRWLGLALQTNDPQMAEDVAMVAYGAACLAREKLGLANLAQWVDKNLLCPGAPHRREDIVVLHAARGVIERARFMGAAVTPEAVERARRLYSTATPVLPIDTAAAKQAHNHSGVSPIVRDLAWYVVPYALQPFFNVVVPGSSRPLDARAEHVLALHAEAAGMDSLTPQKLAFGVVSAHLTEMGWSSQDDVERRGGRGSRRFEPGTHGARSQVGWRVEKYVWTGCYMLQAHLAGRLSAQGFTANPPEDRAEPPVDPMLVSHLVPNPALDRHLCSDRATTAWRYWADDGLVAPIELRSQTQPELADEWVTRSPRPDLRPWLAVPSAVAPRWHAEDKDWLVLTSSVEATERSSQAQSFLHISSLVVPEQTVAALGRDRVMGSKYLDGEDLSDFGEGVRCSTYADPFDAAWAPWVTSSGGTVRVCTGAHEEIVAQATSAHLWWRGDSIEHQMTLPAAWLRAALHLAGTELRSGAQGREWWFFDGHGEVHAVHTHTWAGEARSEALVVRRRSLEAALKIRRQTLVWAAWLYRQPNPSVHDDAWFEEACKTGTGPARRDFGWLAFLTATGLDVVDHDPYYLGTNAPPPPNYVPVPRPSRR